MFGRVLARSRTACRIHSQAFIQQTKPFSTTHPQEDTSSTDNAPVNPSPPNTETSNSTAASSSSSSSSAIDSSSPLPSSSSSHTTTTAPFAATETPSDFARRFGTIDKSILDSGDALLGYFTRLLMKHGEIEKARANVAVMLEIIRQTTNDEPLPLFRKAIELAAPAARMSSVSKGIKSFPVPLPLTEKRRVRQAILWMQNESIKQKHPRYGGRIALVVLDILNEQSPVLDRKRQVHQQAAKARANMRIVGARV